MRAPVPEDYEPRVFRVLDLTARRFDVSLSELRDSGSRRVAQARFVAMAVLRETTALSLPQLGALFDRDHTSVYSGLQRVRHDPKLTADVAAVIAELPRWRARQPPVPARQWFMVVAVTCDYGHPRMVQRSESTAS